ncbi:hypothetical protein KHA90_08145 [Flavobacterium psychroterrae]|uniref:Lipoprotein n=1 Tax=Flavobacterium psychroterrae TaxID=2133767 RepID=A0ABS5P9M1_9FLAO|nr:hypothetical protein [Flavobacterium psychroterrae]MBS7230992.1 hypothetical protein [Flavobacterium psychroterrae]
MQGLYCKSDFTKRDLLKIDEYGFKINKDKMKIISVVFVTLLCMSCYKTDKINHYLNKIISPEELLNNGFYKYSYINTIDDDDKINDTIKSIIKYEMYSNVKPEKDEDGKLYPMSLFNNKKQDSIAVNKRDNYIKNDLNNRIITYIYRDNKIFLKSIIVNSIDKKEKIVDLTSEEKIINYYDSLKIPIKLIFEGKKSTKNHHTLFLINNYKTRIYYYNQGYEMLTNYSDAWMPFWNITEEWYGYRKLYQYSE